MSICLDPTHLVTYLLINFPQLLSLVSLLICSLENILVFAVPVLVRRLMLYALCPALPCPALPVCFFVLFIIINKKPVFLLQLGPRSLPITCT